MGHFCSVDLLFPLFRVLSFLLLVWEILYQFPKLDSLFHVVWDSPIQFNHEFGGTNLEFEIDAQKDQYSRDKRGTLVSMYDIWHY